MKITILNTSSPKKGLVNKDASGGLGTVSHFGTSFMARLLTYLKKRTIAYPVLAIGYLAGILREQGQDVVVSDDVIPPDTDLVIIYSSIVDYKGEIKQAEKVKRETSAAVCVVGPFASIKPELYLDHVDLVIKGEPEVFFMDPDNMSPLPQGIVDVGIVEDLDSLPFPAWDLFPSDSFKYKPFFLFSQGKRFFPIISSRGCTFSCAQYCPYPITAGKKWRGRSYLNVVDEIEFLVKEMGAGFLLFRDPIFTLDKERVSQIAKEIIKRNLDVEYVCETHLNCLDEQLLDLLYLSGLRTINVGIEAASKAVLSDAGRKSFNAEYQKRILSYCDKKGISVTGYYILGLGDDTEETAMGTIEYAKKLNTVGAQFTISTPYPGTQFYDEIYKAGLITDHDFEHYDIYTPVFKHKNLTHDQLMNLKSRAYNDYYLRAAWIMKFLRLKVFT